MNDRIQMMLDHFEIREVLEAYVHACDRSDLDAVKDVYWEDSFDHHGPIAGPGFQFATDCLNSLNQYWTSCTHMLGQSRIRVEGDLAGAETYYFASLTRDQDGTAMLDLQVGRYIDVLERRGGVWRIKDRRCTQEWTTSMPAGQGYMLDSSFLKGSRRTDDLSYRALSLEKGRARIERAD